MESKRERKNKNYFFQIFLRNGLGNGQGNKAGIGLRNMLGNGLGNGEVKWFREWRR